MSSLPGATTHQSGDEGPPRSRVDISEFFFPGSGLSALLIHGLTGTPYEMRYLGERLAEQGIRVRGVRLAGHAAAPEDLGQSTQENWYESVVRGFEDLRGYGDPIVAVGLSCGAVLAARLAEDQPEAVAGLVMLAPAFFLPPYQTVALRAISVLGAMTKTIYLHNQRSSDIHDQAAVLVHPTCRLMPLCGPIELLKLSAIVRARLDRIRQPALIMHSINDHTCPAKKNVDYLMQRLGSARKRAVMLDESYHVITVDSDKDRIVTEVLGFAEQFRVSQPQVANGALASLSSV
jgi:carboxylesterase